MNYRFDDISIDVGQRHVLRDGEQLEVSGLTFDLLLAIVEAAPNIISSDELVEKVWSGRPASPETITQRTMMLRQALDDDADHPKYVEVIRGQGLKLIPELANTEAKRPAPIPIKIPKSMFTAVAAVIVLVAVVLVDRSFIRPTSSPDEASTVPVKRFAIDLGELEQIGATGGAAIRSEVTISPDGKNLVFVSSTSGGTSSELYVRALNQLDAQLIPGTESARHPFFSPDGEWIGFDVGTRLVKVSVRGGLQKTLVEGIRRVPGSTWSEDNTIVFATTFGTNFSSGKLVKVSADGGDAEDLLVPDGGNAFKWPHYLPGGKFILFSISDIGGNVSDGSIALLNVESGQYETLIAGAYNAKYSPTGHIVYARSDAIWAVPFDLESMKISGEESPLFDEIEHNSRTGDAIYDFSDDGLLVYLLGNDRNVVIPNQNMAVWVDRQGNEEPIDIAYADYSLSTISPDGSQAAVTIFDANGSDIWTIDLQRETLSRLTFGTEMDALPYWSADGKQIFYSSRNNGGGIFSRAANGTGSPTLIDRNSIASFLRGVSPDGQSLILGDSLGGQSNIYRQSLEGESFPQPFVASAYDDDHADLSPDGNLVAYRSNETGRFEIYVRTFPNPDNGRWQISTDGGSDPKWNPDGTELFFRVPGSASIFAVDVPTVPNFSWDEPRLLVERDYNNGGGKYAVAADGERFLMFRPVIEVEESPSGATPAKLAIVENWFEELKRLTPTESTEQ